jgi:hypothetical protein
MMSLLRREVINERLRHSEPEQESANDNADDRHGNVRIVTQPTRLRIQVAVENQLEQTKS